MDSQSRRRRLQNRSKPGTQNKPGTVTRRRMIRTAARRNRRMVPRRNRLERAQNNRNRNGGPRFNRRFRRFNIFNRRRNFQRRVIFVGGLPRRINNRGLFNLFRPEGRIISFRVLKNSQGYSRGFGFVEFVRPRDAWRSIQKWNNSTLDRNTITVQFRRRRNFNQNRFRNNNFNNRNNGRFNQGGRGFGFRGGRRGNRMGFRPRGGY
jgi:hypothetical protein